MYLFLQVIVFLWFWLFFLLILSTGLFWTQTRAHFWFTIVPTGVFVYLSLLLFSQSVTIRWFWEPSFYLLSPLQAWPWFDLTVLCENPTKLRLRNYFLSFAVGARPKNFWKDKAKWVFPKKKKLNREINKSKLGEIYPGHYGSILWHDVGKNPILVGYVVLGIGYGVSAHDLSGYKVLGVLVVDNGPHVKEPLTALLKPIPKSWVNQRQRHTYAS